MRDYLIRLIHCYMLGYKVDFSIIYAIMASQSGETPGDKRAGMQNKLTKKKYTNMN